MEIWTLLVTSASLDGVALRALSLEDLGTLSGITSWDLGYIEEMNRTTNVSDILETSIEEQYCVTRLGCDHVSNGDTIAKILVID